MVLRNKVSCLYKPIKQKYIKLRWKSKKHIIINNLRIKGYRCYELKQIDYYAEDWGYKKKLKSWKDRSRCKYQYEVNFNPHCRK